MNFYIQSIKESYKKEQEETNTNSHPINIPNICPITQDVIKTPYVLDCGHIFEKNEIIEWLNEKKTCPVCRFDISKKHEYNYNSESESESEECEKLKLQCRICALISCIFSIPIIIICIVLFSQ